MLISSQMIDASIEARNATRDAKNNAVLSEIIANIGAINAKEKNMRDIIETMAYLNFKDDGVAKTFWSELLLIARKYGVDIYNAVKFNGRDRYAIGVDTNGRTGLYRNLFVLDDVVLFSVPNEFKERTQLSEETLKMYLNVADYDSFLATQLYLIKTIPEFCGELTRKLEEILSNLK